MHRFFLPPASIGPNRVTFPAEVSRQLNLVLRLKPGTMVTVLDGTGIEYSVTLTEVNSNTSLGDIIDNRAAATEPHTHLTLLLGLTQREKFEWMLQKCTEVGVTMFVPVISSRSLVQSGREVLGKYERWQRILREAAEQSHRGVIPGLHEPMTLKEAVNLADFSEHCRLIPWEEEKSLSIRAALIQNRSEKVVLAVGPEGGFSEAEVSMAKLAGFLPVSLGPRILRMETAAITSASLVLYERGDMETDSDQTSGK
jgi:16S rRNA (uracil1498-N3)-methyltransferase